MPHTLPELETFTDTLRPATLPIARVRSGDRLFRVMAKRHSDPLGTGVGSSRFSDPRSGLLSGGLFTTLYAARDLETAFEEVILRDTSNDALPPHALARTTLESHHVAILRTVRPLTLVDLRTSPGMRSIGAPTDVTGDSAHDLSQRWAYAFHRHPSTPDGILYLSRFTHRPNVAVFDRAIRNGLAAGPLRPLLDFDIAPILKRLAVVVV